MTHDRQVTDDRPHYGEMSCSRRSRFRCMVRFRLQIKDVQEIYGILTSRGNQSRR